MLFHSVPGLEKIFAKDVNKPKVILIVGPPGSMKTTFAYTVMTRYLTQTGEFGLYTTLEEPVDSHLANMESLGIKLTRNMQVSDISDLREMDLILGEKEKVDYLSLIEKMIVHFKEEMKDKFSFFTLDSLGALYSIMPNTENLRQQMFYFMRTLHGYNLYSFIIMEEQLGGGVSYLGNEGFLVDGIIHLGVDRSRGRLVRYLQVEKMRTSEHSMEKFAFEFRDGKINILGPIFEQD